MSQSQTSLAREYVDFCARERKEFDNLCLIRGRTGVIMKIREKVERFCRIWYTGEYDDPKEIIYLLARSWIAQSDPVLLWLRDYVQMEDRGEMVLKPGEYRYMFHLAKIEDAKRNEGQ